jgi:hypothetical protein
VIPTKRRKQDDVFLIGEESLLLDQVADSDTDLTVAIGSETEELSSSVRAPSPSRPLSAIPGPRGLALLGLGAAAAATLGALELSGGGEPAAVSPEASARSPLIARSATSAPARAEVPSPLVHPERSEPERHRAPRSSAADHPSEPEREPTPPVAPVSSPVSTPLPSPPPASAPTLAPAPPSPPPTSSGGGSGGVERFGFERR